MTSRQEPGLIGSVSFWIILHSVIIVSVNYHVSKSSSAQMKSRSKTALISLVLSIVSLFFFVLGIVSFLTPTSWLNHVLPHASFNFIVLAAVFGVLAVINGVIALYSIKKKQLTGTTEATIGLGLGGTIAGLFVLAILLVLALIVFGYGP